RASSDGSHNDVMVRTLGEASQNSCKVILRRADQVESCRTCNTKLISQSKAHVGEVSHRPDTLRIRCQLLVPPHHLFTRPSRERKVIVGSVFSSSSSQICSAGLTSGL